MSNVNDITNVPSHIAIIMDGNGRWASKRGLPRSMGHKKGAEVVEKVARSAHELGVKFLTLYAFSTENWNRNAEEVNTLMSLLRTYLQKGLKDIQKDNVKIKFIGERYMLDDDIVSSMEEIEKQSLNNTGLTLCIALSYGSRQEIINAVKTMCADINNGKMDIEDINMENMSKYLYTSDMPDPDLIIRTSGEQRISNYLLWQAAYSELYFTDIHWPDFDKKELEKIIKNYATRERRYGKS